MTAADLKADLESAGFALREEDGRLVVSPASRLSEGQRAALGSCRDALLALLRPPWHREEADAVVAAVLARHDLAVISMGGLARAKWGILQDDMDAAYLKRDFAALNKAAVAALAFLEQQYPRKVGGSVQYAPDGPDLWTGWVKINGRKWVAVLRDGHPHEAVDEFMFEFGKAHHYLSVCVLPSGKRPKNEESKAKNSPLVQQPNSPKAVP